MNVITISRQYGAGGAELAQRLAASLGWELLDRDLLHQAARIEHLPDDELERLDEKALSLADHVRLRPPHYAYLHGLTVAVQQAAARGNVILVGRGGRFLLGDLPGALHVRLVAAAEWRAQRLAKREGLALQEVAVRATRIDRQRDHFQRFFFGAQPNVPADYDLVVNTARVPVADLATVLTAVVHEAPAEANGTESGRRVLTLARELGAGERGFPLALGQRLQMPVFDRELLQRQALRLGVAENSLEELDERPAGFVERILPGGIAQRYRDVLATLMRELADAGNAIVVGRGGSRFLRDVPPAFHVRLVAPMPVRVRRVMEYHWVREAVALQRIHASDAARQRFYAQYFHADWSDPLEYDMTVNTGRLGTTAVELVVRAAVQHWRHAATPVAAAGRAHPDPGAAS